MFIVREIEQELKEKSITGRLLPLRSYLRILTSVLPLIND